MSRRHPVARFMWQFTWGMFAVAAIGYSIEWLGRAIAGVLGLH